MTVEDRLAALPWRQVSPVPNGLTLRRRGESVGANNDVATAAKKATVLRSLALGLYTSGLIVGGLVIILLALATLPANWVSLVLFMGLAGLADLMAVELFRSTKSRVSVSAVIATAGVLLLGPLAGGLIHLASGAATALTNLSSQQAHPRDASWLRRSGVNLAMLVLSSAAAGQVYMLTGGSIGIVAQVSNVAPLVACVAVDVLMNMGLLVGLLVLETGRDPIDIWMQDLRWAMPMSFLGGIIGGGGLALAFGMFGVLGLCVFCLPLISTTYSYRLYVDNMKGHVGKLEEMNRTLDETNLGLLETLGAVMDAYDVYTYGHSAQVAVYADALAEELDIPPVERGSIVRAALVHDIGKIGVLDSIIGKQGPLTDREYNMVKRHPLLSAEIVGRMKALRNLAPLVRGHHERWDGAGYPDGLKGEAIPLGARVLAVADALDALCSDRPYRVTRSLSEVMEEMKLCSGQHFDPTIVAAFLRVADKRGRSFFVNSAVRVDHLLSTGTVVGGTTHVRYLKKCMLYDNGTYR